MQFFKDDWANQDSYLGQGLIGITSLSGFIPQENQHLRPSSSS
jgi:hypothetical protein